MYLTPGCTQAAVYYPQKTEDAAIAILAMAFSSYSLTSLRKVRSSLNGIQAA